MSSTLSEIMNEVSPPPLEKSVHKASWFSSLPIWLLLIGIVALAIYLIPHILDAVSLPAKITEEEIEKVINVAKPSPNPTLTSQQMNDDDDDDDEHDNILDKKGYCYIGTDRGIRSCIDVAPGDKCMSGQIFPRRDICVNPNLRL
jgi:hypothetical protein